MQNKKKQNIKEYDKNRNKHLLKESCISSLANVWKV